MTREELIRMVTQAGWEMPTQWDSDDGFLVRLERFAALVAAAEREECAIAGGAAAMAGLSHVEVAAAIRARGNNEPI